MKILTGKKAVKTYGWAVLSGLIFFGSGLAAGGEAAAVFVASVLAVALKTPFYWLWEHAFEWLWRRPGRSDEASGLVAPFTDLEVENEF